MPKDESDESWNADKFESFEHGKLDPEEDIHAENAWKRRYELIHEDQLRSIS